MAVLKPLNKASFSSVSALQAGSEHPFWSSEVFGRACRELSQHESTMGTWAQSSVGFRAVFYSPSLSANRDEVA